MDTQTFCVRYDPLDRYIAQGCHDGTINIYNVFTGKKSFTLNNDMEVPFPTTCIRWRPQTSKAVTKNVILAVNANGSVSHWHTTSGKCLHTQYDEFNKLLTCDYNNDGSMYAVGGSDCVVYGYDEQTRKEIFKLEGGEGAPGHSNRIFCVKFDVNDPNMIMSGGWDSSVLVWDIRAPQHPIKIIPGPYICGDAIDLSNGVIMSGSYRDNKQLQMWEYEDGAHFTDLNWDEGLPSEKACMLYCLQFEKNNGDIVIAGGAGSNEVKVFDGDIDFKPCAQIKDLSRACFTLDWNNTGDTFAMGGGDGVIRVFNVHKES